MLHHPAGRPLRAVRRAAAARQLHAQGQRAPYHYHTLCPVDCAPLLGNGVCEMRCNITSCAYDRARGVGLDIKAVLKDSGIDLGMGAEQAYTLVVGSVAVGQSSSASSSSARTAARRARPTR